MPCDGELKSISLFEVPQLRSSGAIPCHDAQRQERPAHSGSYHGTCPATDELRRSAGKLTTKQERTMDTVNMYSRELDALHFEQWLDRWDECSTVRVDCVHAAYDLLDAMLAAGL